MSSTGKEFYSSPYYFFIKENKSSFSLYYSVESTLTEARKKDEKINFNKENLTKVKRAIYEIVKSKKKYSKTDIKKKFESLKTHEPQKKEIEEFINDDGNLATSKIPILDLKMHPRKTTDQTVPATRQTNDPVTRGYRTYYNETELKEIDYSDAFGYEETKDMDAEQTKDYLINKMGLEPEDAQERMKQFGKHPKKKKNAPKHIRNKKGFIDRLTLSEIEKEKMTKMVEDILTKKYIDTYDVVPKERRQSKPISKILLKNIKGLKKLADREGLTIKELLNLFKNEQ